MRTWRVGTISMGASLLFLGIVLLLSQLAGLNLSHIMISWWPIILIVLGIEILVYLYLSRQEKPLLRYDFLSIFFVGIIGTIGIGFVLLNATGLLDRTEEAFMREQRTFDLPALSEPITEDVKRVVLKTEHYPLTIEGTAEQEVAVFGTYTTTAGKKAELISAVDDYISSYQKGDTLYLDVKELPREMTGFYDSYTSLQATVLVPTNIKLEIIGDYNPITLKPRLLMSNWNIENVSDISVYIEKNSDIAVSVVGARELKSGKLVQNESTQTVETVTDEGMDHLKSGNFTFGQGTHSLTIMNAGQVSIGTVN